MAAEQDGWERAAKYAATIAPAGPVTTAPQMRQAVRQMRFASRKVTQLVPDITQMRPRPKPAAAKIIDRASWITANMRTVHNLLDWINSNRCEHQAEIRVKPVAAAAPFGLLSSKVLGQVDPFAANAPLLLVAPNIYAQARNLGLNHRDFYLWVALHEQTHRQQLAAAPWLTDYLRQRAAAVLFSEYSDDGAPAYHLGSAGSCHGQEVDTAAVYNEITVVMSILEGHAEVTMDDVGDQVIPSVARLRRALNQRRSKGNAVAKLVFEQLGVSEKLAQYRRGAQFVRHTQPLLGKEQFNGIFSGQLPLPSVAELADPDTWLSRVDGY